MCWHFAANVVRHSADLNCSCKASDVDWFQHWFPVSLDALSLLPSLKHPPSSQLLQSNPGSIRLLSLSLPLWKCHRSSLAWPRSSCGWGDEAERVANISQPRCCSCGPCAPAHHYKAHCAVRPVQGGPGAILTVPEAHACVCVCSPSFNGLISCMG